MFNGIEQYLEFKDVEIGADFKVVNNVDIAQLEDNLAVVETNGKARTTGAQAEVDSTLSSAGVETDDGKTVVVVLDPGHGGKDGGASRGTLIERDINLKIAQACYDELTKYGGVKVYMTRPDNDTYLTLAERAELGKSKGADVLVSLHINSANGAATGVEVWTPNKGYNYEVYEEGQGLSHSVLSELTALGLYDRGVKIRSFVEDTYPDGTLGDYYGIIRESKLRGFTAIIVEHAFIDNANDQKLLADDAFLAQMGVADATGIAKYFGLKKAGLMHDGTGWKYKQGDGTYFENGWMEIGNYRYFFEDEYAVTGWKTIDGEKYFFMPDGFVITGWFSFGKTRYYADSKGEVLTGAQQIVGKTYVFNEEGIMQTGWQTVDGVKYFVMPDGYAITGWFKFGTTRYYADKNGKVLTGAQTIDGKTYVFNKEGIMQTGWRTDGGKKYFVMPDGHVITGWFSFGKIRYYASADGYVYTGLKTVAGQKYYFGDDGIMQTGWKTIDGKKYYFMPTGYAITGWFSFGKTRYYAGSDGSIYTGLKTVAGQKYYFSDDGIMQTGWKTVDGNKYYFMPTGYAITGWFKFGTTRYYSDVNGIVQTGEVEINGTNYLFDASGVLIGEAVVKDYAISGTSAVNVAQMVKYYKASRRTYPASVYADKGAATIEEFCQIYYEEAAAEGIRAEVAFCQAMKETGWLKFGGDVKPEQCNFAGIGATGGGVTGAVFDDVRMGVRAHVQHLKAYANAEPLVNPCVDPRFKLVKRGCAPYVEWLSQSVNPEGYGWAPAAIYGTSIVDMIKALKKY